MSTTIKSIILASLRYFEEHEWKSRGELFQIAQSRGYAGSQERLLQRADELSEQGVLEARQRGRMQYNWYRLAQSSPLDKDPNKRYTQRATKMLDEKRATEKAQRGLSLDLGDSAQSNYPGTDILQETMRHLEQDPHAPSRILRHPYKPRVSSYGRPKAIKGRLSPRALYDNEMVEEHMFRNAHQGRII